MNSRYAAIPILRRGDAVLTRFTRRGYKSALATIAFLLIATTFPTQAQQNVRLSPDTRRVFVGANFTRVYSNLLVRVINSGDTNQLDISGVGPANTGITFSTNSIFPTTNTATTTTVTMFVAVTNIASGTYPITINVTGGGIASTNVELIAGHMWNPASTNDVSWSTAANWTRNSVPGSGDDVLFKDSDVAVTNYVPGSISIGSLVYLRDTNNFAYNTAIAAGATLSIVGTNGFVVNVDSATGNSKQTTVNFHGPGARMVVSNQNANFTINSVNGGANGTTVNMTNLDTFVADVSRFGAGDYTLALQGGPGQQNVVVSLAKTNIIHASYDEPFASDSFRITNAIQLFQNGNDFNNGSQNTFNLGVTNAFFAQSFGAALSRVGSGNNIVRFHPAFISTNFPTPSAYFRSTNGGRMRFFGLAIDETTNSSGSNSRITANFNGGTLDLLADEMVIGRNTSFNTNGSDVRAEGHLSFTAGTVDVNILRLGYQAFTNNVRTLGDVTVASNGVLVINNFVELGHHSGDSSAVGTSLQGWGRLIINSGGTVRANQIILGQSNLNNFITMNGGRLVVSNTVASSDVRLRSLTVDGNSVLTLFVDASLSTPYVYVSNLVTLGTVNTIRIGSLANVTTYPAVIPLISYEQVTANPNLVGDLATGGLYASIENNTANKTIDLVIDTNAPPSLVWDGTADGNWNTTSLNWNGGTTNFSNGSFVTFNDTSSRTNVSVVGTVIPGQSPNTPGLVVSNSANHYTFSGGTISGSGSMLKQGSGVLTIDATSQVPMLISDGAVTGSGAIGITVVGDNGVLSYSGSINGGVDTAGTVFSAGTINGPVSVQSGGILTNAGTMSGSVDFGTNALLANLELGVMNVDSAWVVDDDATLVNSGSIIQVGGLTVIGMLTGTGTIERHPSTPNVGTAPVSIGGTFSPGNSIGTNRIFTRLNLNSGSTTLIEVDIGNGINDLIVADTLNFGTPPSPAIIRMTNIGTGSFAAGQAFQIFTNSFGDPFIPVGGDPGWNTNNIALDIRPVVPGFGLVWDKSDLRTNGIIRIGSVSTTPPDLTSALMTIYSTNAVTTNITTNVVFALSWPEDHTGWRLEAQTNTLNVGISTNWSTVPFSYLSNQFSFTFVLTNPAVFYRLAHP